MGKSTVIKNQFIFGWIFTLITGTLLHFVFEWSGNNKWVSLFAPINESTWEHLKLLFFPILVFLLFQILFLKRQNIRVPNLMIATATSALSGMLFIVVSFYTYSGVLGYHVTWIDILIFALAVTFSYYQNYNLCNRYSVPNFTTTILGVALLLIITLLFFWFTFSPPPIALFQPPI